MLLRMFSTDVEVREEHPSQAPRKQLFAGVAVHESKKLAGKLVRLEQLRQANKKDVPAEVSIKGKLVDSPAFAILSRLEQPLQVTEKSVPEEVSISGKLVRLEQSCQVPI